MEYTDKRQWRRHVTKEQYDENVKNIIENVYTLSENLKEISSLARQLRDTEAGKKVCEYSRESYKLIRQIKDAYISQLRMHVSKQNSNQNNNYGFLKAVPISKHMAEFSGWEASSQHSRTDITKCICSYISENNLRLPRDGRKIKPDAKLSELLGTTDVVTDNYIQKVLKERCCEKDAEKDM